MTLSQRLLIGAGTRLRPRRPPLPPSRRWISRTWLAKKASADRDWAAQAEEIKAGRARNPFDLLDERGYIHATAGTRDKIRELFRRKRTGVYAGVDPTADSLHLGHLIPFMVIFWMWFYGFQAITLLGGSTARIGDPTDRLTSRPAVTNAEITKNITKIHYQITKLWHNVEMQARRHKYEPHWGGTHRLINNNTWFQGLSVYDMMKRLGRHTRLGPMLSRETVKNKLEKGDGMSFAEFMYPLFQGWDFWHLYSRLGVQIQVGGQDQFGNIVQGVEIVKTIRSTEENPSERMPSGWCDDPYGLTTPLLTDSSGAKLGKSDGNAIWLDPFKTTPFDLYGYFMRRSDPEVERFLRLFTFLPMATVRAVVEEHEKDPPRRVAQHVLAYEAVCLVHGSDVALREQRMHRSLFAKGSGTDIYLPITDLVPPHERDPIRGDDVTEVEDGSEIPNVVNANNAPRMDLQLPESVVKGEGASMPKILFAAGMAGSRSEGQRLIGSGAISVAAAPGNQGRSLLPGNLDWTPAKLWFREDIPRYIIDGTLLILRRGKHHVRIIELISDEAYSKTGKKFPGMHGSGVIRQAIEEYKAEAARQGVELPVREVRKRWQQLVGDRRKSKLEAFYKNMVAEDDAKSRRGQKLSKQDKHVDLEEDDDEYEDEDEYEGGEEEDEKEQEEEESGKGKRDSRPVPSARRPAGGGIEERGDLGGSRRMAGRKFNSGGVVDSGGGRSS